MRKKDVVEEEIEYLIEQKMNPKDKKEREEEENNLEFTEEIKSMKK